MYGNTFSFSTLFGNVNIPDGKTGRWNKIARCSSSMRIITFQHFVMMLLNLKFQKFLTNSPTFFALSEQCQLGHRHTLGFRGRNQQAGRLGP